MNKAIVLLSGGLDSVTTLYYAKRKGYDVHCLIFQYGQKHKKEIKQAEHIARLNACKYEIVTISLPWKGSALLDKNIKIPSFKKIDISKIPSTYVPARNIIFLGFAASYAEAIGSRNIFIGANAVDYSGYPDCRPEFIEAYERMLAKGLKTGVEGKHIRVKAPLIKKTKADIVKMGMRLKVPYELTWSCYHGRTKICGKCDSCRLRIKGFEDAGFIDPLI